MTTIRPKPGQVYVSRNKATRTPTRRVIAVVNKTTIVYSDGGEQNRHCQLRVFRRWAARYDAVATRTRRPRSIVLR